MFNHLKKNKRVDLERSGSLQSKFFNLDIDALVKEYQTKDSQLLEQEGFVLALRLFHEAAERVPAYRDFLFKNKIDPKKIKTLEDFKTVPIVDKKNYLKAYPLNDLCWDGKMDGLYIVSSSSGSTGEPFLWPRGEEQELEGAINFELIFKNYFHAHSKRTLFINCFSMGTWIAGPYVLSCLELLAKKGYPIIVVTPGLDRDIAYTLFRNLHYNFDQVIFGGYPPLIKDFIDHGEHQGINWREHVIKFFFAAEGFSEKWRNYVHKKVGATDILCTSINIYGSADAGNLAHETPLTTAIRRSILMKPTLHADLFSSNRMPTLTQYDPRLKYFEESDGKIIFTTKSGIPLIRYSIGDEGGVINNLRMSQVLKKHSLSFDKLISSNYVWNLPFVYVFGRSDLTVSFYGLLIYPEHIKYGLERAGVDRYITGKFVLSVENYENQDQYLVIHIELAAGQRETAKLKDIITDSIVKGLKKVNSEYKRLSESLRTRALPVIELVENGDTEYFKPGAKQRWVKVTA